LRSHTKLSALLCMAGTTGLEPATSAVTGQRSNQLSYVPQILSQHLGLYQIESESSQLSLFSLYSTASLLWTDVRARMNTKRTTATTKSSVSDIEFYGVLACILPALELGRRSNPFVFAIVLGVIGDHLKREPLVPEHASIPATTYQAFDQARSNLEPDKSTSVTVESANFVL
jgi:hypothetical protein